MVELIETVILYKLPRLSREEIQAMLQVQDIRETRIYQEAKEEGLKEGMEKGMEKGMERGVQTGVELERQRALEKNRNSIVKMATMKLSPAVIADILDLELELVHKV